MCNSDCWSLVLSPSEHIKARGFDFTGRNSNNSLLSPPPPHSSRALRSPTTAYFNLQTLHSFDFLIGVLNTPGSFKAAMTFNLFHSYLTVSVVLVALLYCSLFEQFQFLVSELNPARIHLTGVLLLVLIYHVTH